MNSAHLASQDAGRQKTTARCIPPGRWLVCSVYPNHLRCGLHAHVQGGFLGCLPRKKFVLKIYGYGAIYRNFPFFTKLRVRMRFFCRPAADSILMPTTFPIASLNRYTPNFSGVTQKLTWCQQFGLQIFPK